jgi:hypothetical protein
MSAESPWGPRLIALLLLLAVLLVLSDVAGRPSEAAQATPQPQATAQRGVGRSPGCILGDINCDGIVDIRDYGIWRANFGATDCGNLADLNDDCIVDIRDYGIWRANFGQTGPTATPTMPPTITPTPCPASSSHAYVANPGNSNVMAFTLDGSGNIVPGCARFAYGPPVAGAIAALAVNPADTRLYVVNTTTSNVTVFSLDGSGNL